MKVCIVSFKECWQDSTGRWMSYGGFPLQMEAICSLFEEAEMLIVASQRRDGGHPLPAKTRVVPLREPAGQGARRKLSVVANLGYYLRVIGGGIRRSDVVHVPLPGDLPLLAMILALFFRKKLIARYGGSWQAGSMTTVMNRVTRSLMRVFAGGRNVMLATGEDVKPPARGMHWLYATAMSRRKFDAIEPVIDRGLSSPPRLVYAGRLSPEKGVDHLIRAVALLKADAFEPLPRMTLIGDGPQRAELEALTDRLRCRSLVQFTGQVNRDTLSVLLCESDLGVHASLTESLCKAWIDMMAHGLPVICYAVGAAPGVFEGPETVRRGWTVPPGQVEAFAGQIKRVIRDPADWPSLRRRCRAYAADRTLESWRERIGAICAETWNGSMNTGQLITRADT